MLFSGNFFFFPNKWFPVLNLVVINPVNSVVMKISVYIFRHPLYESRYPLHFIRLFSDRFFLAFFTTRLFPVLMCYSKLWVW